MRNQNRLFIILLVVGALLVVTTFFIYPKLNKTKALKAGSFKTETVDRGTVIPSIIANGIVEPENEVLVLSPARAIIKKVLKDPGTWVEEGELILRLDEEDVRNEIERITDQLKMKRNSLDKTQLNAQSSRLDVGYNEEVKKLRIASLQSTLTDQQELLESGGISPGRIEKTKQEIRLAEKDLEILAEKNSIRLKQLAANEKGLVLQIESQERSLQEKRELLKKLSIVAPSNGIILEVAGNTGVRVDKDKALVLISDLTSFKVNCSIDEDCAGLVKTGNPVIVLIDNEKLPGHVGTITPMEEENSVQFNVHLNEKNHPKLIVNQRVDVQVLGSNKEGVLRIKYFPGTEGNHGGIYVVKGDEAVKTEVIFGAIGNDFCEIISGLNEGDKVIVDGIIPEELDRIKIKN